MQKYIIVKCYNDDELVLEFDHELLAIFWPKLGIDVESITIKANSEQHRRQLGDDLNLEDMKKRHLKRALETSEYDYEAAKKLGINPRNLSYMKQKYNL